MASNSVGFPVNPSKPPAAVETSSSSSSTVAI
eukprot:CAMPEP_0184483384 /NCGR_PEP_ID=MMETSP0113_2-20130426/5035_1 /TAXON_ID=91329 /ORGANISM="Norrisiella sphaerica, Strain BC52" /LENGTH=31 /DNA_ID= /DNA_START= /DNA_END= /DNA_ORIENTATION=